MEIIADLHFHSKYSKATSKDMNLENIEKYAKIKGLNLLTTSDFTHPLWFKEIKKKLVEEDGILYRNNLAFLLTTEINLSYLKDKERKVHLILFSPNLECADQINEKLSKFTDLSKDARPTLQLSCVEFLDLMLEIDKKIIIIPAHCMTPWYGIFGSKSGFNKLSEAFEDKTKFIYAVESGLSASPDMLWRIEEIRKINIVSFSDSHSYWPWRLGREATIFELNKLDYNAIYDAIKNKDGKNKIKATIEVDPAYGKYHWDGHRNCNIKLSPEEAIKLNNICPKCGKKLTIGVEHRVNEISDKPKNFKPDNAKPFFKLLPLTELIANFYGKSLNNKKVSEIYNKLIKEFDNEFNVLMKVEYSKLKKIVKDKIAELIIKNREGKIKVDPGYDGVYGKPIIEENQKKLF
ncbi:MAG: endonuclease Q family protein [Candidatus Pacearchaeota archaeon]